MAERLIAMQDNNQFQTLCGSFDENLKLLEQRYHVQMICRGDELRIQGDGAAVELAAGAGHCTAENDCRRTGCDAAVHPLRFGYGGRGRKRTAGGAGR